MTRWRSTTIDWRRVVLWCALGLGIALRFLGLNWGLPLQLNPDEWVIVTGALDLAQRNSFEPSLYFRPDHVEIQLSYFGYQAYAHLFAHTSVELAYAADPGVFLLISRSITALFGVASMILAYFIGRRFNRSIAVIALVLFSIYPPLVRHAHFASPDVPLTAALLGVVLALIHYMERPSFPSLLFACGATAIAITIKYPGAIATVMIAVVVIFAAVKERQLGRIFIHGVTAIGSVLVFLFLISPVLFTNFQAVVASIHQESRSTHLGADGLGWVGNLVFYGNEFFEVGGILLSIMGLVGVYFAIQRRLVTVLPVLLGSIFWVILSAVPLHWERWGVPMAISPLILGSIGIYYSYVYLTERFGNQNRWRRPVLGIFVAVITVNLLVGSLGFVVTFLASDTRIVAAASLEKQGIQDGNTLSEGYTAFRPGRPVAIFGDFQTVGGRLVAPDSNRDFVMTSSCMRDRYFQETKYVREQAFYNEMERQFDVEFRFTPTVYEREGVAFEPINIFLGADMLRAFVNGGSSGCTLTVYRIVP